MNVYDFEVTFERRMQPKEYESAAATVTFKVALDEGEDAGEASADMLQKAKAQVLTALGLAAPADKPKATRKRTPAKKKGEETADEISDAELNKIAKAGSDKHTGKKVKELMSKRFKVMRLGQLDQKQRAAFKEALEGDELEIPSGD